MGAPRQTTATPPSISWTSPVIPRRYFGWASADRHSRADGDVLEGALDSLSGLLFPSCVERAGDRGQLVVKRAGFDRLSYGSRLGPLLVSFLAHRLSITGRDDRDQVRQTAGIHGPPVNSCLSTPRRFSPFWAAVWM